jgi:hypothetical protein
MMWIRVEHVLVQQSCSAHNMCQAFAVSTVGGGGSLRRFMDFARSIFISAATRFASGSISVPARKQTNKQTNKHIKKETHKVNARTDFRLGAQEHLGRKDAQSVCVCVCVWV